MWQIMLPNGRIIGPYSTETVLKMIQKGSLSGEEHIRKNKTGNWIHINRQPQFYDALIENLMQDSHHTHSSLNPNNSQDETIISSKNNLSSYTQSPNIPSNTTNSLLLPSSSSPKPPPSLNNQNPSEKNTTSSEKQPNDHIVDLSPMEDLEQKKISFVAQYAQQIAGVFLFLTLIILIGYFFIFDRAISTQGDLRLIRLSSEPPKQPLTQQEIQKLFKKGIHNFSLDQFENYYEAQLYFAKIIENQKNNLQARGFLCLTYRELWPFVIQDSYDYETFSILVKQTKALDPVGEAGALCEISRALALGQTTEARGIVDYYLDQVQYSNNPIFIALKGEILGKVQDFNSAFLFIDTAQKNWNFWIKFEFLKSQYLLQTSQILPSYKSLETVLKNNPHHKTAMIQKGFIEYRFQNKPDIALNTLNQALNINSKIQKTYLVRAYTTLARIYFDRQDIENAKKYTQLAFTYQPNNEEVRKLYEKLGGLTILKDYPIKYSELISLGDQYVAMGDCLSAQAEYKTAFELNPKNPISAMKAGRCLWELSRPYEAIEWLKKAIKIDPKFVEAAVLLADYLSQRFNFEEASLVLSNISRYYRNHPDILKGYGILEFRRNSLKSAINYLNRSLKIFENNIEALIYLSQAHHGLGQITEAQNYIIRALEIESTNAKAINTYAKNLLTAQGSGAAINYLNEQIKKYAYTLDLRVGLAEIYYILERYQEVERICRQVLDFNPQHKKAWTLLGKSLQDQLKYEEAIKSFIEASIIDPFDPEPLYLLATVYYEKDDFDKAMYHIETAIKANNNYPNLHYYAGQIAFKKGNLKLAMEYALKEKKKNPHLVSSYLLAAEIYDANQEYQLCAQEYQKTTKVKNQNSEIYIKMARCYRLSGMLDMAESMLSIAASLESGRAEIYREQGAIFEAKLEGSAAIASYEKYLMLSPNAKDKKEIQRRVEMLQR